MNQVGLEILMFVISLMAVLLSVLGIPGNFVPVAAAMIAVLFGDGSSFNWGWFALFLVIAASGEIADQLTGIAGARKHGATRPGMVGAAVGGIVGGVVGTMILPVIGSIAGVFIGCFVLTFVFEIVFSRRPVSESGRSGIGAVLGRVAGTAYKFVAGFILLILMGWRFWVVGS